MVGWKLAAAVMIALALPGPGQAANDLADVSAARACLKRDQRNAMIASGRVIKLAVAIRHMHRHYRGDVIRARLCRARRGYVYLLTVLTRNGKVIRCKVDARTGRLISVR